MASVYCFFLLSFPLLSSLLSPLNGQKHHKTSLSPAKTKVFSMHITPASLYSASVITNRKKNT